MHSALSLMGLYQCIKFYFMTFYTFRDAFYCNNKKDRKSVNTGDRVMVLALYNSPHGPLSVY